MLAGVFGVVAIALLYACLAIGPMSILSPLTAVVSAIAPMLWGLLVYGETLAPLGYVGLGVALVAVVLVGFIPGEKVVRPTVRGLVMAVGAGIAIGAFLIVIDQTSDESGLVPLVMSRATTFVVTLVIVGVLDSRGDAPRAAPCRPCSMRPAPRIGATPTGHADLEHTSRRPPMEIARVVTQPRGVDRGRLRSAGCRRQRVSCSWRCASASCRSCRR